MPKITITATGIPAVQESLDRRSGPHLDRAAGKAAAAALRAIRPLVRADVPIRTGRARRAVRVSRTRRDRPGAYIGFSKTLPYRGPLVRRTGVIVRSASSHASTMFAVFYATLRTELDK